MISHEPHQEPQAFPGQVIHRDSGIADNELSTPYKVEDSYLGEATTSMPTGSNLSGFNMLLPEDARCSASLELMDNPDWLLDAELAEFVTFTPDDSSLTGNGHPPTPPDSPDYNSSKTTAAPCSSTSDVFCPLTPRSSTAEPRGESDDVHITGALMQLQLRLHEAAKLPIETLLLQPKSQQTLIEETLETSQTFTDLLKLMSQGQSQSQAVHASADSPEPTKSPEISNLTATSRSSSWHEVLSPLSTSLSPPPAISASASLLTLLCYLGIIKAYENVLRLLRSVLQLPVDNATSPGATNPGSFGAADMLLLPQISIGSIRPLTMACLRTQAAVLALLLSAKFDEVRGGIGQLVAASSPLSSPDSVSSAACDGCERPKARPATVATELTSLAGEGLWRAEAKLKRQLVAMTQLLV